MAAPRSDAPATGDPCALANAIDVIGDELTSALRAHIAAPDPTMLVVRTRLAPPPTDRQRWYRPTPMIP